MSLASAKNALETAIKAVATTFPTGWENVAFVPPSDGSAFQIVNFLPASPFNPTMGTGFHRDVGIMQVMLSYPIDGGSGKAYTKAEVIKAAFKRGSSFASGGITVKISATPTIAPGSVQANRFLLPIRINFIVDVYE